MTDGRSPTTRSQRTERLLRGAGITIFAQDTELRYLWLENPPPAWKLADAVGKTDREVLPAPAAVTAAAMKREALRTARPQWSEVVVRGDGRARTFDLYVEPTRDEDGLIDGIVGLAIDVTDRRQREESLEAAIGEAAHRSRNLMAVLQGIATHTARSARSTDDFIELFRTRMQAVLRSHDLLGDPHRRGAPIDELVHAHVDPYVADAANRVEFRGETLRLRPNAALHIGIALSELAANAVQFGALSNPTGSVRIVAERLGGVAGANAATLRLSWQESGGPAGAIKDSFGRVILERLVPKAVAGDSRLESTADGTFYEVTIAASEFE